jgi:hypothetical protein
MRVNLLFVVGPRTFGLGFILDWYEEDYSFELQLGPFNLFGGDGWGLTVTFLGRQVYQRN